jgi:hypothetical protein
LDSVPLWQFFELKKIEKRDDFVVFVDG